MIRHSIASVITCWQRHKQASGGTTRDDTSDLSANLHVAHLLLPLLHLAVSSLRYRQLGRVQKAVAFHACQAISRRLVAALPTPADALPKRLLTSRRTILRLSSDQPIILLDDIDGRLNGTEGRVKFACVKAVEGAEGGQGR